MDTPGTLPAAARGICDRDMLRLRPLLGHAGGRARARAPVPALPYPWRSSSSPSSSPPSSSPPSSAAAKRAAARKAAFEPPAISLDPARGGLLHEKAAKAAQLHRELEDLLEAQERRRAEELSQPFGSGFLSFLRRGKSEFISIFAAFCCVLLAYQIASMRRGARALLDRAEEREATLADLRATLAALVGDDGLEGLADACARAAAAATGEGEGGEEGEGWSWSGGGGGGGWFARAAGGGDVGRARTAIRTVLERELRAIVGDRALNDQEMEEKRLSDLKGMMGVSRERRAAVAVAVATTVATTDADAGPGEASDGAPTAATPPARPQEKPGGDLGELEELIVEAQVGHDGAQLVKRRKYAGSI